LVSFSSMIELRPIASKAGRCMQCPKQARSRGARQIYFTYHTLTGRIFLRPSNGIAVRLTAHESPSSRLRFDRKDVPRYNMLTVTTDPDLNRNERFRTPLHVNYMGMKCLGSLGLRSKQISWCRSLTVKLTVGRTSCLGQRTYLELCWAQHTACENQVGKNATAPATRFPAVTESR
jgi:hypothetical protein